MAAPKKATKKRSTKKTALRENSEDRFIAGLAMIFVALCLVFAGMACLYYV